MLGGRRAGNYVIEIFRKVDFWISFTTLNLPGVFFQLSLVSYLVACKSSARSIGRAKSLNGTKVSRAEVENSKIMKFAEKCLLLAENDV